MAYEVVWDGYKTTRSFTGGRLGIIDTLRVTIKVELREDPKTGQIRYSYQVKNESNSSGPINYFELGPIVSPDSTTAPEKWSVASRDESDGTHLLWRPAELGPPPAGWVDDGVSLYPSAFCIAVGDSLAGFGFASSAPSNFGETVPFTVRAFEEIRPVEEEFLPYWPFEVKGRVMGPRVW